MPKVNWMTRKPHSNGLAPFVRDWIIAALNMNRAAAS